MFSHLVHITRTDHPGALVAGRKLKLRVLSFRLGGTEHTHRHGEDLLKQILVAVHVPQAKLDVPQEKQLEHTVLQYIDVTAPREQEPRFPEVAPEVASDWRSGLNLKPNDIGSKLRSLLHDVSGPCDIDVDEAGQQVLVATVALKEGAVAAEVRALIYDSDAKLQAFLKTDDACKILYGACVKIRDVEMGDSAENPVPRTLFAVMVGREMLVKPASAKHRPNVKLVAAPSCGPNDGFLKLVVATRNNSGIGKGAQLYMDFGTCYNHEVVQKQVGELSEAQIQTNITQFFSAGGRVLPDADKSVAGSQAGITAGCEKSGGALAITDGKKSGGTLAITDGKQPGGTHAITDEKKSGGALAIADRSAQAGLTADTGGEPPEKRRRVDDGATGFFQQMEELAGPNNPLLAKSEEADKKNSWDNLIEGLTKLEWVHGENELTLFMEPRATGKRLKPNTALTYASVSQGMTWSKEGDDYLATLYDVHRCFCTSHFLCWKLHVKETKDKFIRCRCNRPGLLSCAPP